MALPTIPHICKLLKSFDFPALFNELGWDYIDTTLEVPISENTASLRAVGEKRGFVVFVCGPLSNAANPDARQRRAIDREVSKRHFEHILVFINAEQTKQVWHWASRGLGKRIAHRESTFHRNQTGEHVAQRLRSMAFDIEEEAALGILDVAKRARKAFDVEHVTKRFYDVFKKEHAAFLPFIKGLPDPEEQRWYASVIINRLMFVYFIQKKGFLNSDAEYLQNRLQVLKMGGKDRFYREFLLALFFKGFAQQKNDRDEATRNLLGEVPYLNGGLFLPHKIEEDHGGKIEIADAAFEKLFAFFDQYRWHLDERPLRKDNEINPDVLGYIFEKYINQKQMGAYYTKEDITGYIARNTVIPRLLDIARENCKVAFSGESSVWRHLREDPDRYIYHAVRHGVTADARSEPPGELSEPLPLPPEIAEGIGDVSKRTRWNTTAPPEYGLPTEIWREVVARRQRYEEVRKKLASGGIQDANDLITYNLDIQQFAQDVVERAEGPEFVRAVWQAIAGTRYGHADGTTPLEYRPGISVLDPTCGSGAFLFAALNILEPLYEACLDRMEVFIAEADAAKQPKMHADFRHVLRRVARHPNRPYFIYKSIIVNNLFGVDIMDEAVEICKLRLFLKLVAQVETAEKIEPLPDIDFNIRAGNTLVGFATYEEVEKAVKGGDQVELVFGDTMKRIDDTAQDMQALFDAWREQQTEPDGTVKPEDKTEVLERLHLLQVELDGYLASQYGVRTDRTKELDTWKASHRPFHWFIEFYGTVHAQGGFDVIIGNPPYLEFKEVEYAPKGYACLESGAIHAVCVERGVRLLHADARMSMIVPLALTSTQRMKTLQGVLESPRSAWYANFAWRPGKLFDTVNRALSVFVVAPSRQLSTFSTDYQKWTSESRDGLFDRLTYVEVPRQRPAFWVPKLGRSMERTILDKCLGIRTVLAYFVARTEFRVYYRTTGGLYWKVFTDTAPAFRLDGKASHSSRETWFAVVTRGHVAPVVAVLSSDLYWWWYTVTSNLRDLNPIDIHNFPVPASALSDANVTELGRTYLEDIHQNSTVLVREQKQTGRTETQSFKIQKSKPIIDEIDRVLARHYGFTDEELDFIINYDIKYRMGADAEEAE